MGLTLAAVVAVLAVLVGLNVGGMREQLLGGASAPKIGSVAVLPLVNLSGDPEQEYFADGMTEALITNLAKIGSLKVISRTSVMRYKGSNKTSPEIAQELGVEALLEGSVMRASDRVRITVQLFHAATDEQIWAESYERELRDILILQGEVAHEIARQIRLRLTPEEEVRLARARPVNPEAHQTYLRGRYHLNRATAEGFNKAIEHFNEAIEKDPGFALAYAGLAEAYVRQADWQLAAPHEVSPQAEAAAMKALEIDETLAQAHANLGYLRWGYRWDWAAPEKEFQRAIALNPSDSTAHFRYSSYLLWLSRFDEAIAELKRAQELDPLSLVKHADLGVAFYVAGDYDRAIEQLQGTLELDSDSDYAHWWLGVAYLEKARYEEAIAEIRKAIALSGGAPNYMAALGVAYATAGNAEAALKVLEELNALSKRRYVSSYQIARVYAALGEKEQAFRWLEKAHEEHAIWFIWLRLDLAFADLRSDPRFQDLVRRMNLPES